MLRPLFALAAATATLLAAPLAQSAPIQPFTMAALHAAQAQGRPILVDAYADWCPTCRAQAPTIAALSSDPAFGKLIILRLDYDKQSAEKRSLNIRMQSTLIAFKGATETGRLVGVTDPAQIRALANRALH